MKITVKTIPFSSCMYIHLSQIGQIGGWGNGYVGVPSGHPWYRKQHAQIDCIIHGGLTYSSDHWPGGKPDGRWWIGFDTAHSGDNSIDQNQQFVVDEANTLVIRAAHAMEDVG